MTKKTRPLTTLALAGGLVLACLHAVAAPPTAAEVGDADSFGRRVVFAGLVVTGGVALASDCTPDPNFPPGPEDRCVVLNTAPLPTTFSFPDIGRITLPGSSVNSLLCHWATANVFYSLANNTAAPLTARFSVRPTYRIESEVLADPALINPQTSAPFGGGIDLSISGISDTQTLAPGAINARQETGTRTCVAGLVSKASLSRDYGLSDSQIKRLFQRPITIRVGVTGRAIGVADASMFYSTRFTGDER